MFGSAEGSRCHCLAVWESAQRRQRTGLPALSQQELTRNKTQSQAIYSPKNTARYYFNRHNLSVKLYTKGFTEVEFIAGLFQYIRWSFLIWGRPPEAVLYFKTRYEIRIKERLTDKMRVYCFVFIRDYESHNILMLFFKSTFLSERTLPVGCRGGKGIKHMTLF